MLHYLWSVVQDLFLTVTYTTLIHSLLRRLYGKKALRAHNIGLGIGVLSSAVFSYLKLTSNLILTSQWNHMLYAFIMGFTLVFLVSVPLFGRREHQDLKAGGWVLTLSGTGVSLLLILYRLPVVMMYPFNFNTMGNGFFSSYYMDRLLGWALALAGLFVYARVLDLIATRVRRFALLPALTWVGVFSYGLCFALGRFLVPWVTRARWLKWPVKFNRAQHGFWGFFDTLASTYSMGFIWLGAGIALILMLALFLENLKVRDPYSNSAQLRKLRARNRGHRRVAVFMALLLALMAVDLTAVKAYDTREVVLSAPETYVVTEDEILVPIEDVSDGHLHRYEYRTPNGVNVRWIVVKKPGSASFGVGLDACEVCGAAGYYEREGKVVCKRCDVVMNINTIGFKGGCNPIPLKYEVRDGSLAFRLEDLIAGEREFR